MYWLFGGHDIPGAFVRVRPDDVLIGSRPLLSGPTGLIGHDYAAWDHQDHQAGGAGVTSAGAGMSWRAGRSPLLGAQSRGPSSLQRMGRK